jgi:4-hydroxybenzoate polyprenyltransferase
MESIFWFAKARLDVSLALWYGTGCMPPEDNHPAVVNCALCVDLDGTLCRTNTLWDLATQAFRRGPEAAVCAVLRLAVHRRPERIKADLADIVDFEPGGLPWRPEILDEIRKARGEGRKVALATASTSRVAEAVAAELGLFDAVFASTRVTNLKGKAKADALAGAFEAFEYIGNSPADQPVWQAATRAACVVVKGKQAPPAATRIGGMRELRVGGPAGAGAWHLLRPHQWVKNLLVFVPVLTSHRWSCLSDVTAAAAAFVSLSLAASAVYCINDILDAPEDRRHPEKRHRPVASGAVPIPAALAAATALAVAAFAPAFFLPSWFTLVLAAYFAFAGAYVVHLKRLENWDYSTLGLLYMLRVVAGGAATGIGCSLWLLGFAGVFFANLALLKRYAEIILWRRHGILGVPGRAYVARHVRPLHRIGRVLSLASGILVAVYAFSPQAGSLYDAPLWLLGSAAALLVWERKMWFRAARGKIPGDPVLCAMRLPCSYLCAGAAAICVVIAMLW